MTERDHKNYPSADRVALAFAGIARARAKGAEPTENKVDLGGSLQLDTTKPNSIEPSHWPGHGVTVAGSVTDVASGKVTDMIVHIGPDGTHPTEMPDLPEEY